MEGKHPGSVAALLVLSLLATACGGSEATTAAGGDGPDQRATGTASAEPEVLSGTVEVSGSSTVEPVSVRVAELFEEVAPGVVVNVDGPGTGDGFKLFCEGITDISDASRAIKDKEAAACAEAGVDFIELQVGIDGIAVITNSANSAVECVTKADLYALAGPEAEGVSSWSGANALAAELGGLGGFPDQELVIFGPGAESGTYDSFNEMAFKKIAKDRDIGYEARPDYNSSADDNVILSGIQSNDTGLGWVGFAFAAHAADVKLLDVDEGAGCVTPTAGSIAAGDYPLSRPLFIYVNAARAASSPALAAYVDFYMDRGLSAAVPEVGYVALADDLMAETRNSWDNR